MSKKYYLETNALYSIGKEDIENIRKSGFQVATSFFAIKEVVEGVDEKTYDQRARIINKIFRKDGLPYYPYTVRECIGRAFNFELKDRQQIIKEKLSTLQKARIIVNSESFQKYCEEAERQFSINIIEEQETMQELERKDKEQLSTYIEQLRKIVSEAKTTPGEIEIDPMVAFGLVECPTEKLVAKSLEQLLMDILDSVEIVYDKKDIAQVVHKRDTNALVAFQMGLEWYLVAKGTSIDTKLADRNDINDICHLVYMQDGDYVIVSDDKIYQNILIPGMRMNVNEFKRLINQ